LISIHRHAFVDDPALQRAYQRGVRALGGQEFYQWHLLDTFAGLDPRFVTAGERRAGAVKKSRRYLRYGFYHSSVDRVRANFARWRNLRIIVGAVPESLGHVDSHASAFLHIDMNCAAPEVDTLCFFGRASLLSYRAAGRLRLSWGR
jgi:hypothetical protein